VTISVFRSVVLEHCEIQSRSCTMMIKENKNPFAFQSFLARHGISISEIDMLI
jgi:hypothetical protein